MHADGRVSPGKSRDMELIDYVLGLDITKVRGSKCKLSAADARKIAGYLERTCVLRAKIRAMTRPRFIRYIQELLGDAIPALRIGSPLGRFITLRDVEIIAMASTAQTTRAYRHAMKAKL